VKFFKSVLPVALGLALSLPAHAGFYSYTQIATTPAPGVFSVLQSLDYASLNSAGTVAFRATPITGGQVILSGNGGQLTTVATTSFPFTEFSPVVSINSKGAVAFRAHTSSVDGGIFGVGTPYLMYAAGAFAKLSDPSLNDAGSVSFGTADFIATQFPVQTILADTSGPFQSFGGSTLNNAGEVLFGAVRDSGETGIYKSSGGAITAIADTNGPYQRFFGRAMNDAGTVAFGAVMKAGGQSIFSSTGAVSKLIASTGGGSFSMTYLGACAINNDGDVAFACGTRRGDSLRVAHDNGAFIEYKEVIRAGQILFGTPVLNFYFIGQGFNDAGQVAFLAQLANDQYVIVRADPL
jgi:hypothetical protein